MNSLQPSKKHVEINPHHPLIVELCQARNHSPGLARLLAAQIYDNCLVHAGLMMDCRAMVTRVNELSLALLQEKNHNFNSNNNNNVTVHETSTTQKESTIQETQDDDDDDGSAHKENAVCGVVDDNEDDMTVYSDDLESQGFEENGESLASVEAWEVQV